MLNVDETRLNTTEQHIMKTLSGYANEHPAPSISEAAAICGCSISQVSKTVRKAGYQGYKQYIRVLYSADLPRRAVLEEIERLKRFLEEFDPGLVAEFVGLLAGYRKIILFGYGPSLICAQYIEYKLRFCIDAHVATAPDEHTVRRMVDSESLLVILTATGRYRGFDGIVSHAETQGAAVVVVSEEYNPELARLVRRYLCLSEHRQSGTLEPHQMTRTVFFIFFEQVVQTILSQAAPS